MQPRFGNECDANLDCLDELINKLLLEYEARRTADNKDRLTLISRFRVRSRMVVYDPFLPFRSVPLFCVAGCHRLFLVKLSHVEMYQASRGP